MGTAAYTAPAPSTAPYTGSGSAAIDLATASPAKPATMFSTDVLYTLVARGAGLGSGGSNSNEDDLSYYTGSADGDGVFSCRVLWVPGVSGDGGNAGGGIMVRNSLENNAANVAVLLTDGNGVTFQWRQTVDGAEEAWPMSIAIGVGAPTWVRLAKSGDKWTVSYSQDGTKWYNPTSVRVKFPTNSYYVGLAATTATKAGEVVDLFDKVEGFNPHMYTSITPSA